MSFMILKDLFQSSFFKSQFEQIFLASSHMLSSFFSPCRFYFFLLNCFFMASFAIFIDFFATFQLLCSPSEKSSSFDNSFFTVRSPFYRCFPKFDLNRVCLVTACFLSLYWNSTVDNYSIQFVIIQRPQGQSIKRTLYWVNTRELNRELCTRLSILYTNI